MKPFHPALLHPQSFILMVFFLLAVQPGQKIPLPEGVGEKLNGL